MEELVAGITRSQVGKITPEQWAAGVRRYEAIMDFFYDNLDYHLEARKKEETATATGRLGNRKQD
jgi:hypothetical protein